MNQRVFTLVERVIWSILLSTEISIVLGGIMAVKHVCPKCNGTDVYFTKKQIITGIGGIYGNRQKEVERPFCRKCDIEARVIGLDKQGREMSATQTANKQVWGVYVRISIVITVLMLGLWLWSTGLFS